MMTQEKRNPGAVAAAGVSELFCLAAERSEDSRLPLSNQVPIVGTVLEARATLLRDFVFEALAPVESDAAAARLCLKNDDDGGTRYHLKRIVQCIKAAASTFRELEALAGRGG